MNISAITNFNFKANNSKNTSQPSYADISLQERQVIPARGAIRDYILHEEFSSCAGYLKRNLKTAKKHLAQAKYDLLEQDLDKAIQYLNEKSKKFTGFDDLLQAFYCSMYSDKQVDKANAVNLFNYLDKKQSLPPCTYYSMAKALDNLECYDRDEIASAKDRIKSFYEKQNPHQQEILEILYNGDNKIIDFKG